MRLIDADALIAELHKTYLYDSDARTAIYQKIEEQPTVDAVEVVRCRDCKHNPNDTWFECPISNLPYKEDRWCWKGERQ